jgi:hypothetical protein
MKCNNQRVRFTNKNTNENERNMFANWWSEATQLYGTSISYFVHPYSLSGHDFLYGEEPTAQWPAPITMLALAQLNNDSLLLSKFGIQTDADLTVVIPIKDFAESVGNPLAAPKAGDLLRLDEVGWDRPGGGGYPNSYPSTQLSGVSSTNVCDLTNPDSLKSMSNGLVTGVSGAWSWDNWLRGPNVYEITERRDENFPGQMNPLMAHIVWYIKCKRFDYSYEPNAPREHGSNQISDNTQYGKVSGTPTIEPDKKYNQDSEDETKKSWNYDDNGNKDSVYGGY